MINFITTKHFNKVFYLKDGQHGLKEVVKICFRGFHLFSGVIESIQQRNIDIAQTLLVLVKRVFTNLV